MSQWISQSTEFLVIPSIANLNPPHEIAELGNPERVYQSHQVTALMKWTTYIFGTLSILLALGILFLRYIAELIPAAGTPAVYVVVFLFGGGGLLMHAALWWMKNNPPKYLYALFPQGLVICQSGKWGLLPWKKIVSFEQKAPEPYVRLDNRVQIPIRHDFPVGLDLYTDIAHYLYEKDRQLQGTSASLEPVEKFGQKGRFQLITGGALLAASVAAGWYFWEEMVSGLAAIKTLSEEELIALADPGKLKSPIVFIAAAQAVQTNGKLIKTRLGIDQQNPNWCSYQSRIGF